MVFDRYVFVCVCVCGMGMHPTCKHASYGYGLHLVRTFK